LEAIYSEIAQGLDAEFYYLALVAAVSLPDVCVALEGKQVNWKSYKDWVRRWLAPHYQNFGEHECYELRCGVMHQAVLRGARDKKSPFKRFSLQLPNQFLTAREIVDQNAPGGPALGVDLIGLCLTLISAAREWEASKLADETVQANKDNVVRYRTDFWSPKLEGFAVIA